MKERIKAIVKSSRSIYFLYYYICSFFLRLLGLFVRNDPNLVLFVSYGGKKFDDSPRVVYEHLLRSQMSKDFQYVWAFVNPETFPEVKNKVKIDTLHYFIVALKARYWITNSSASRGLNFRKTNTRNVLFQHGMAGIKKIGKDVQQTAGTYRQNFKEQFDMIFVEGKEEIKILVKSWEHDESCFFLTGLPRNDDLVSVSEEEILRIRLKLKIPSGKRIILYAPTFREHSRSLDKRNVLSIPFNFEHMKKQLGDKYVILITAHYEVAKLLDELPDNDFVINCFRYPEINDLLKISDVLISDYSSVVFDYSILERPILCYGYDYDSYKEDRGFYNDPKSLFSHGVIRTQEELEEIIRNIDYEKECEYTREKIKKKYIALAGGATERAINIIFDDSLVSRKSVSYNCSVEKKNDGKYSNRNTC